ncbi:hypothetical protein ABK040_005300 [Willaertia magna]
MVKTTTRDIDQYDKSHAPDTHTWHPTTRHEKKVMKHPEAYKPSNKFGLDDEALNLQDTWMAQMVKKTEL